MHSQPDFSKIMAFTDIHFGLRLNSKRHNEWCQQFVEWAVEEAKKENIKTLLFLGDWHHNRSTINVTTLNYSYNSLKILNSYFDDVIMILGNHDLYFKDKLDVHSIPYANEFENITVIDKTTIIGDFCFVPWLVGDEWKEVAKITSPYVFCHAEIATFFMNEYSEMPDHGKLNVNSFPNQELVFSGHFHKRQQKKNILYMGNTFPHDFADVGDDERGLMIWEPGKKPEFRQWAGAPKYRKYNLSEIISNPVKWIDDKTFATVAIDVNINYEESTFIRELLETQLNALDITFTNQSDNIEDTVEDDELNFESVDTIVVSYIKSIESTTMDPNTLISIYQGL